MEQEMQQTQTLEHVPSFSHSGYLSIVEPLAWVDAVEKSVAALLPLVYKFDAIAVRGNSGILLVGAVATRLNKTIILVRKPYELETCSTHSYYLCEGDRGARTYVILDDFICGGTTVRAIRTAITGWTRGESRCIGMVAHRYMLWKENSDHSKGLVDGSAPLHTEWMNREQRGEPWNSPSLA